METLTIQGLEFTVPVRYAEGHELTAGEASALNQTYHENIRNNLAGKIKKGTVITQNEVDAYADSYIFGVRTAGAGRERDPVKAEFMRLAKAQINAMLKKQGKKASGDAVTAAAEKLFASPKGTPILELAKQRVAEQQAIASDNLDDLIAEMPEKPAQG